MEYIFSYHGGKVCRSSLVQHMMIDKLNKLGLKDEFIVESKALSKEEIGNDIHYGSKRIIDKYHIAYGHHSASEFNKNDYQYYDYIILMDYSNLRRIKNYIEDDNEHKISLLLDDKEVADPWYTGDFEKTYQDLSEGIDQLLKRILAYE